jgi:cytochrome c oxidase assembly factor CtaG
MLLHATLPLEWVGPATVVAGLTAGGLIYAAGWRRYRRRLPGRFTGSHLAAFLSGLGCLAIAIASPLDEAADRLLSAHMGQHILLLTAAPALLLLGEPLLRGLPDPVRRTLAAPLLRRRSLRAAAHALVHPLAALLLNSVIFWSWHLPALYQLALRVPALHLVEHASFFVAGLVFWYPVVLPWPGRPRWPSGATIPYLLVADVQNTLLAAVLTFSDRVLYPFYEFHSRATEVAALDDQVLAGVIMWVPMSLAYLVPAALLTIRLLSPAARGLRTVAQRSTARAPMADPTASVSPFRHRGSVMPVNPGIPRRSWSRPWPSAPLQRPDDTEKTMAELAPAVLRTVD